MEMRFTRRGFLVGALGTGALAVPLATRVNEILAVVGAGAIAVRAALRAAGRRGAEQHS